MALNLTKFLLNISYDSLAEFRYRFYVAFPEHVIVYSDVMISSSCVWPNCRNRNHKLLPTHSKNCWFVLTTPFPAVMNQGICRP